MSDGRFAGVDWASEEHALCVVDDRGRIVEGRRYRHNELGIRALCARLVRLGVELVALERPDGLLIERLLDAGLAVVAVHPNQVKAMRPRYSVAGGKSDSFDSFVLAELARTDSHRFRVLVPDSDQTKALRAMTRARDGLVRTRVGLANQLRDQLATFWPPRPRERHKVCVRRDRKRRPCLQPSKRRLIVSELVLTCMAPSASLQASRRRRRRTAAEALGISARSRSRPRSLTRGCVER